MNIFAKVAPINEEKQMKLKEIKCIWKDLESVKSGWWDDVIIFSEIKEKTCI